MGKSPGSWSSSLCSLQVIWRNLLICVILFYTVYYVVLGVCCVMLKVYELDVLAPFDFKTNPSWLNTNYKVTWRDFVSPGEGRNGDVMGSANGNVIPPYSSVHSLEFRVLLVSTEVTYFVCGLLFVLVVEEWVWDYGISVTILHVAITSTVMLEFPLTSHWWAALGFGLISMICGGQTLAYCSKIILSIQIWMISNRTASSMLLHTWYPS